MKDKLNELGSLAKKQIPAFITFISLGVVGGIALHFLDTTYTFPLGYVLGRYAAPLVEKLVRNNVNLK